MGNKILIFSFIFFTTSLVTCFFMLKLNNVTNNEGVQIMTGNIIMNKENQDDQFQQKEFYPRSRGRFAA